MGERAAHVTITLFFADREREQGVAMIKSPRKRDPAPREVFEQSFKGKMAELVGR